MKKILLFLLLNISLFTTVLAEDTYIGASIGDSKISLDNYSKPIGYKAFLGAHINDRFGIEIGLINLGEFKRNTLTNKVTGTELSGVGFIPLGNDGSVFGKIGLFNWTIESTIGSIKASSNGTDLTIGLGVQYPIKDNILVRLEYQEFRDIDDSNDDFTFLSLGFVLSF